MQQEIVEPVESLQVEDIELGVEVLEHILVGCYECGLFKNYAEVFRIHGLELRVVFLTGLAGPFILLLPGPSNQEFNNFFLGFFKAYDLFPNRFIEIIQSFRLVRAQLSYYLIYVLPLSRTTLEQLK